MLRPLNDGIVVRPDAPPPRGLILLPDEEPLTGTVVAVGPGRRRADGRREAMWVKEGDRVQFSGTLDRQHDGFLIMKNGDLIGLID